MSTQSTEMQSTVTPPPVTDVPMTLSIAGYGSAKFDKFFWQDVNRDEKTGLPVSGSLGIHYDIHENLMTRFEQCGRTWEGLNTYLSKNIWIVRDKHYISRVQIAQINEFLSFAEGKQPYFYLRKGKTVIGLCKKTSGYIYDYDPARKTHLPHRINFEFVRPPISQEVEDFMTGPGKTGIPKTIVHQPLRDVPRKEGPEIAKRTALIADLKQQKADAVKRYNDLIKQIKDLKHEAKIVYLVNDNIDQQLMELQEKL